MQHPNTVPYTVQHGSKERKSRTKQTDRAQHIVFVCRTCSLWRGLKSGKLCTLSRSNSWAEIAKNISTAGNSVEIPRFGLNVLWIKGRKSYPFILYCKVQVWGTAEVPNSVPLCSCKRGATDVDKDHVEGWGGGRCGQPLTIFEFSSSDRRQAAIWYTW